ncbi:MAG: zinc metalloprotease HtpX [Rhodospirillales bacterium]
MKLLSLRPISNTAPTRNTVQAAVFLLAMFCVLSLCAWVIGGLVTVIAANALVALSLTITQRLGVGAVMRLHRARALEPWSSPEVHRAVAGLARKAGLPSVPALYRTPSGDINAFTTGDTGEAGIAVTEGALRRLSLRELTGVLAHEIAHLAANDTKLMFLSEVARSVTATTSIAGLLLIIVLDVIGQGYSVPPWMPWALWFAPIAMQLLQMGLSRNREFAADLEAARLTGDPVGLASALRRIDLISRWRWPRALVTAGRVFSPSLLHSHPPTDQRVAKLLAHANERADDRVSYGPMRRPVTAVPAHARIPARVILRQPPWPFQMFRT